MVRNPLLISLLRRVERVGYRVADRLVVICEAFARHAIERQALPSRVAIVENWIDVDEVVPGDRRTPLRRELGFSEQDLIVLWAGTIGHVAGTATLLDAAALCTDGRVRFLIVGEGPVKASLVREAGAGASPGDVVSRVP